MADQGPRRRIPYAKPEALDLGAVAPVIGGSCATGNNYGNPSNACYTTGNNAEFGCSTGNGAALACGVGNSVT